jgi:hypothetical protein
MKAGNQSGVSCKSFSIQNTKVHSLLRNTKSGVIILVHQDRECLRELCEWMGWRVIAASAQAGSHQIDRLQRTLSRDMPPSEPVLALTWPGIEDCGRPPFCATTTKSAAFILINCRSGTSSGWSARSSRPKASNSALSAISECCLRLHCNRARLNSKYSWCMALYSARQRPIGTAWRNIRPEQPFVNLTAQPGPRRA